MTDARGVTHIRPPQRNPCASGSGVAAIIIAAFRCDRWIEKCLESLVHSIDARHHIYVVDNGENKGAIPDTLPFANYTVLKTEHSLGFAEANNYALVRLGRSFDYYCFLNQDTISSPGWLDCCIECMESDPTIGAMMPMETLYDGSGIDPACGDCLKMSTSTTTITTSFGETKVALTPQITAAAMVARADLIAQVGPFDPVFESYCEDYDLGDRIASTGHALGICHGPTVAHYSGSTTTNPKARIRRDALSLSNRALLKCRRQQSGRWWLAAKIILWGLPYRIAAALLRRPKAPSLKAVCMGYSRLFKILPRLFSAAADKSRFEQYLSRIGWAKLREEATTRVGVSA